MATRTAQSSGNWADIWDTLPETGDDIDLAGYTVTVPNGYTTAVIRQGAGASQSVGVSGSTLDIKSGGKLRHSGNLRFNAGCELRIQGGATIEASPATDGGSASINMIGGSVFTTYDTSNVSRIAITRSGSNKSASAFLFYDFVAVSYMDISTGGYVGFGAGGDMRCCDVSGGSYLYASAGRLSVASCFIRGSALRGITFNAGASACLSNVMFGRSPLGVDDPHTYAALRSSKTRITGSRVSNYSPVLDDTAIVAQTRLLGILDYGYTDDDAYMVDGGSRGAVHVASYYGSADYTPAAGKYSITPSSNVISLVPLLWPDEDITGLLSASIPAAEGQAVALAVSVTPNASQTADSVRLVLDPDNMYGCYAVSAQATPSDATTELTASGTVAAGVSNVLIPWRIEINAYAAGGVVDVESAAATVDGVVHTLDQRSMRWIAPAATGGRRRCDFAGVRFAT